MASLGTDPQVMYVHSADTSSASVMIWQGVLEQGGGGNKGSRTEDLCGVFMCVIVDKYPLLFGRKATSANYLGHSLVPLRQEIYADIGVRVAVYNIQL